MAAWTVGELGPIRVVKPLPRSAVRPQACGVAWERTWDAGTGTQQWLGGWLASDLVATGPRCPLENIPKDKREKVVTQALLGTE